jgi:YD repeat-containing protein
MGAVGGNGANAANFGYAYTLDNAGHRTSVTEQSGRKVNYAYDNIYRLTTETIASDPGGNNGSIGYTYDPVGNRTQQTSTVPAITSGGFGYDADDRLAGDVYDANGNTVNSGGIANVYDFENHLIQQGGATMVYDGNGNRASKTVAGLTTNFLISEINPTGYARSSQRPTGRHMNGLLSRCERKRRSVYRKRQALADVVRQRRADCRGKNGRSIR